MENTNEKENSAVQSQHHEVNLEALTLNPVQLKDLSLKGIIGDKQTFIAFKDPKSYLVGTYGYEINLFESGRELFCYELDEDDNKLWDIVYAPAPLNCYFLASLTHLYRKDINKEDPKQLLPIESGTSAGASLRYSTKHQRLIVNAGSKNIVVINPETNDVEIEVQKSIGDEIRDFQLLGKNEDKVVAITPSGYVILYHLDYTKKSGEVVNHLKIDLIEERREYLTKLAIDSKNEHLLIDVQRLNPFICSRLLVLKISGTELVLKTALDQTTKSIKSKSALECLGYSGTNIAFIGLTQYTKGSMDELPVEDYGGSSYLGSIIPEAGIAQIYVYNIESEELRELDDKRVSHGEYKPTNLHRVDGKFYYTGHNGKLMILKQSY